MDVRRAVTILVLALGACVVGGLLDGIVWPGTALALFRPQVTLALVATSLVALGLGARAAAVAGLVTAALGAALLVPTIRERGPTPPVGGQPVARLLVLNLWARNDDVEAVTALIARERPDVVGLTELTPAWARALAPALRAYRVRAVAPSGGGGGIGVYGREPLESAEIVRPVRGGRRAVDARIVLPNGGTASLLVVHPTSALVPGDQGAHERELAAIGAWARAEGRRSAVCGDLNAAPWTRSLRHAIATGQLRALLPGGLFAGSWPALPPPLRVAIDGCLVGDGLRARARLGPRVGSDHLPVLVELS